MAGKGKRDQFRVEIASEECKGCGRCLLECPVKALEKTSLVNLMGCVYICYTRGCIGCGSCFYACPEPGAITVLEVSSGEDCD